MARPGAGDILADRYRLAEHLGAGGMGAVFRAHDELLGDDVALKVLLTEDPKALGRMRDEVRLARRVTHRNVARTFDLGRHAGSPFVTMELLVGPSLGAVLRHRSGADAGIVGVLAQIAEGLGAAHGAAVVHRDLKPSNILLVTGDDEGRAPSLVAGAAAPRAVLIDFGISMAAGDGPTSVSGTWDYMSPEQLRGEPASAPSDVFALGLVAFRALAGAFAYRGATPQERALARIDGPPDLRPFATLPAPLRELVASCLADQPADRPSATDVSRALRAWLRNPVGASANRPDVVIDEEGTTAMPLDPPPRSRTMASAEEPTRQVKTEGRVVAVAPLEPRGSELARVLARGISVHLCDQLGRARGLLVASTALFDDVAAEGARAVARRAGVDILIEGALEVSAEGARVDIRLVDLITSTVLLERNVAAPVSGLLDLGADLAGRVAEALRVELEVVTSGEVAPAQAIELYLDARHALRRPELGGSNLVEIFDRCLAIAPDFVPARVSRALALARIYSFANRHEGADEEVERAILDAEALAPEAPDTLAARACFALQRGNLRACIRAFSKALAIAPTHPFALEQLGRLACESGRTREGIERLELAAALDPMAATSLCLVARSFALRGQLEAYERVLHRLAPGRGRYLELARLELRIADWYGHADVAERVLGEWPDARPPEVSSIITALASIVAGRPDGLARLDEVERYVVSFPLSPRFRGIFLQSSAEVRARREPLRALALIEECVGLPFFDVEWMELCPALDGLRDDPRFVAAQRTVRDRVSAVWEDATSAGG